MKGKIKTKQVFESSVNTKQVVTEIPKEKENVIKQFINSLSPSGIRLWTYIIIEKLSCHNLLSFSSGERQEDIEENEPTADEIVAETEELFEKNKDPDSVLDELMNEIKQLPAEPLSEFSFI